MKVKFKTVSLNEMIDKHIGKIGTSKRDHFENELKIEFNKKTSLSFSKHK